MGSGNEYGLWPRKKQLMSRPGGMMGRQKVWAGDGENISVGPDLMTFLHRLNRSEHGLFHTRTSLLKLSSKVWGVGERWAE